MRININMQVGQLILRFFQIICAAGIIIPAVILIIGQIHGGVPAATIVVFLSACLSVLVAFYGFVASLLESLQGRIMAGFDGIVAALFVVNAIIMTVKLGTCDCDPVSNEEKQKVFLIDVINGGALTAEAGGKKTYIDLWSSTRYYVARCGFAKVETVFLYFGVILVGGSLIHDLCTISHCRRTKARDPAGLEKMQTV